MNLTDTDKVWGLFEDIDANDWRVGHHRVLRVGGVLDAVKADAAFFLLLCEVH